MSEEQGVGHLGWHTISGRLLLASLHRVAEGEDPDDVYTELYANAEHEYYVEREEED